MTSSRVDGGADKNDHLDEKARTDLASPVLYMGISHVLRYGAVKYAERNWERGMSWGRSFGALLRHLFKWWMGEQADPETGMSHLWHAGCCLMFLAHYEEYPVYAQFDDRPTAHLPSFVTESASEAEPLLTEASDVDLLEECGLRGWTVTT